jgi:hypothetical protein
LILDLRRIDLFLSDAVTPAWCLIAEEPMSQSWHEDGD